MSRTRKHKVGDDGRECSQCDEYKPWDDFSPGAGARGRDTRCKPCMRKKGKARNALPEVQEAERARWQRRWEAAHPGEVYERRQCHQQDEYGRVCSYSGKGSCGHAYKPWSEFQPRAGRSGRETRCTPCMNARVLFQRFGITEAELEQLKAAAVFGPGLCDLHGGPETMQYKGGEIRGLSIDHDHDCDQGHAPEKGCRYCIRGLLCCDCNRNIVRRAEQYPELAKRFADYLVRRPLLDGAWSMV